MRFCGSSTDSGWKIDGDAGLGRAGPSNFRSNLASQCRRTFESASKSLPRVGGTLCRRDDDDESSSSPAGFGYPRTNDSSLLPFLPYFAAESYGVDYYRRFPIFHLIPSLFNPAPCASGSTFYIARTFLTTPSLLPASRIL